MSSIPNPIVVPMTVAVNDVTLPMRVSAEYYQPISLQTLEAGANGGYTAFYILRRSCHKRNALFYLLDGWAQFCMSEMELYLGRNDSPENWREIPDEEVPEEE